MKGKVSSTGHARQLGKGQDIVYSGERDGVTFLAVGDGHGPGAVVMRAKGWDWDSLWNKGRSVQDIMQPWIDDENISGESTSGDGMTLSVVRVYDIEGGKKKIEIAWIGDSSVGVWDKETEKSLFFNEPAYGEGYRLHEKFCGRVEKSSAINFEVVDDKVKVMTTFDDTLTSFNAMIK